MPEHADIWLAARNFIDRYGDRAAAQAGVRLEELSCAGDAEGRVIWTQIQTAIEKIQQNPANSTLH